MLVFFQPKKGQIMRKIRKKWGRFGKTGKNWVKQGKAGQRFKKTGKDSILMSIHLNDEVTDQYFNRKIFIENRQRFVHLPKRNY